METTSSIAIIPARMGSSRFPGKPLALINGKPMIGHVYENVSKSSLLSSTVVATCDAEIFDYIESIGGIAVMTGKQHERASDRCAEALQAIEAINLKRYEIIVMVQGDEPMIHSDMIHEAINPMLADANIMVTNLLGNIQTKEEFEDRNCIKVVCDLSGNALYFSREPIPSDSRGKHSTIGKQICVIPFRREFLIKYTAMAPTPLEIIESIDMLRVLEHGIKVKMVRTNYQTQSVDTLEDLKKVEIILNSQQSE